jgi:hypothetical protein
VLHDPLLRRRRRLDHDAGRGSPGAISQGRTREEARENVVDALRLILKPEPGESMDPDREPLDLPLAS